ncbi:MAG: LysR family transcriptional regulator [Burkholderiaceae bacterium]
MTTKKIALENMNWDDLRIFMAVVRAGSISIAARQLKVDHSTVSRHITRLELCLGGALFKRRRTGLEPTDLATGILPHVEVVEGGVVGLREKLRGNADDPVGPVRIAMMEGIGSLYLTRRLAPLAERYPGLIIELVTSPQQVNVSRREADIFVSFFEPSGQGMSYHCAGRFVLNLYGADAYFRAYGRPQSVDELDRHWFTGYLDDMIQLNAVRWLEEVIAEPRMRFRSNSMIAQMTAASAGLGLALLPRFAVEAESALEPVLEETVRVSRGLWLSVHHDLQYVERVKAVLNYLDERLRDDQPYLNGSS